MGMGKRAGSVLGVLIIISAAVLTMGCDRDESIKTGSPDRVKAGGCSPRNGGSLFVLADDRKLEAVGNIIPAVNANASRPALVAALDKASSALTQERLIALNKATDVDHKTPKAAAQELAGSVKLTDGVGDGPGGRIIIGVTNFNESQALGFVYQLVLSAAGYDAIVQPMGARELYEPALERGEIQVVPEYTSTITEFLNAKVNGTGAPMVASGDLDKTVKALRDFGGKTGLVFGNPAPAGTQNAFAVTKALADAYSLKTLSDFAARCSGGDTVLGGPQGCDKSSFCGQGLKEAYHVEYGGFVTLDAGGPRSKGALKDGKVTIALVFSSDAELSVG